MSIKKLLEMSPRKLKQEISGAFHFSLWLIPVQTDKDYFAKTIDSLSYKYKAPVFEPHLSIFTGICTKKDNIKKIISTSVKTSPIISLSIKNISCSDAFFKSVFIKFDNSPILVDMQKNVMKKIKCQVHYDLQPHLSLIYKKMPMSIKQDIAKRLNIKKTCVTFDSIRVVTPQNPTQGWLDISKWETILEDKLNNLK